MSGRAAAQKPPFPPVKVALASGHWVSVMQWPARQFRQNDMPPRQVGPWQADAWVAAVAARAFLSLCAPSRDSVAQVRSECPCPGFWGLYYGSSLTAGHPALQTRECRRWRAAVQPVPGCMGQGPLCHYGNSAHPAHGDGGRQGEGQAGLTGQRAGSSKPTLGRQRTLQMGKQDMHLVSKVGRVLPEAGGQKRCPI